MGRRRDKKYVQNNNYYDMRDRDGRFSDGSDEDEYEGDDEEVRRPRQVRKTTFRKRAPQRERVRTERKERPRLETGHGRMKRIHKRAVDRTRKRSIEIEAMLSDSDFSDKEDSDLESEREEAREKDAVIETLREEVRRLRNLSREESDELGERRRRSRRASRESWAGRTSHSI